MSYYIVKHDGIVHQIIDKSGKPNKYGEPKIFESLGKAVTWCDRHTYVSRYAS